MKASEKIYHYLYYTSVNLVHNAPVELPPARSFFVRAPPSSCWPPLPSPSSLVPPVLAPPISWVITVTKNKTHQKKKKKKTKVRAMPGNCPDKQIDTTITLIYKINNIDSKILKFSKF